MDISAIPTLDISDIEDGEIFEGTDDADADVIIEQDETFYEVLKRASKNCNISHYGLSLYDPIEVSIGASHSTRERSVRRKDTTFKKEIRDFKKLCQDLNESFKSFNEKRAAREADKTIDLCGDDDGVSKQPERSTDSGISSSIDGPSAISTPLQKRTFSYSGCDFRGISSPISSSSKPSYTSSVLNRALERKDRLRVLKQRSPLSSLSSNLQGPSSSSTPRQGARVYTGRPALTKPLLLTPSKDPFLATSSLVRHVLGSLDRACKSSPDIICDDNHLAKRPRCVTAPEPITVTGIKKSRVSEVKSKVVDLTPNRRLGHTRETDSRPSRFTHTRSRTTVSQADTQEFSYFQALTDKIDKNFEQVLFVDLDNWRNFFGKLNDYIPDKTFVWGFWGGTWEWHRPLGNRFFAELVAQGRFEETMAGRSKDAADFAMVFKIGQLSVKLQNNDIAFTVISGDRGFEQLNRDTASYRRPFRVFNPHALDKYCGHVLGAGLIDGGFGRRRNNIDAVLRHYRCQTDAKSRRRSRSIAPMIRC